MKYALISAQRCMICQGDIARYREQATDSANYGKARRYKESVPHYEKKIEYMGHALCCGTVDNVSIEMKKYLM